MALPAKLRMICRSRPGSPITRRGAPGAYRSTSSSPFSSAFADNRLATSSTATHRSYGIGSMVIFPASIFEKSRISLMIVSSASAEARVNVMSENLIFFAEIVIAPYDALIDVGDDPRDSRIIDRARQPGQSGNPAGIARSRLVTEECFYASLIEQGAAEEAASLLWDCARKREPWAHSEQVEKGC